MQSQQDMQRSSRSNQTYVRFFLFTQRRGRNVAALFLFKAHNNTERSAAITGTKTSKAALDAIAAGHAKVIKK